MTTPPKPRQKRPRAALNAERIADEAMRLIDEAGLDGFSFRTLAARLGCQAMSLYHYFPSKAHLFEALVDTCIRETPLPPEDLPWRERIRRFTLAYRDTALRHPGFFLYFATFRLNNRAGMTFLDGILKIFEAASADPALRARQFRTISYYVTGACLDEALGYANGPSAMTPVPADEARRDFPSIIAVGQYFGKDHHEATFLYGLEVLLDRIEADTA